MRIASFIVLLTIIIGTLAPAMVWAQYEDDQPSKMGLKLGFYRPAGADDRAITDNNWIVEELTYDFKHDEMGRTVATAELGLFDGSGVSNPSALMFAASRIWISDAKGGNSLYYGAGAGLMRIKFFDEKNVKPMGQLFAGYNFGGAYFAELRLLVTGEVDAPFIGAPSLNMTGYTLSVGTKKLF
ncbi:MAG: hypothetical protein Q7N50_01140 [Armatimonadota bacterium]|nr:hypothetical protein [Armatimonadota bacterium]